MDIDNKYRIPLVGAYNPLVLNVPNVVQVFSTITISISVGLQKLVLG